MYPCKSCYSTNTLSILNLGDVALAGDFLSEERISKQKKYPLEILFCSDCALLQVKNDISPDVLFKTYFYSSSTINTLVHHYEIYAKEIIAKFNIQPFDKVLEIGCNDGVLLNPLYKFGIKNLVGIDPAENITNKLINTDINIIQNYFSYDSSVYLTSLYGKFNYIIANNVFAHISNINDFVKGIQFCLNKDGVYIFEVHDIESLIDDLQFDMIYHEHIYYYSLISINNLLNKYNLRVFDLKEVDTHAGSIRYYVCHYDSKFITTEKYKARINYEYSKGYSCEGKFLEFSNNVNKYKTDLINTLRFLINSNKKIIGYGASGRASTLSQFCKIDNDIIQVTIDDSPLKHGFFTPGCHYKIFPKEYIKFYNPDFILLYAWSFKEEIVGRNHDFLDNGGIFIIPLPKIKFILKKNGSIIELDLLDYFSEKSSNDQD